MRGLAALAPTLLAAAALIVALLAWQRPLAPAPAPTPAAPCRCEATAPDPRVEVLEAQVARLEQQAQAAPALAALVAPPPAAAPATQPTRYQRFIAPVAALRIEQAESGALAVFNADPALTGQILEIRGVTEDGDEVPLTVTIPAP
ncbi:MAG: hypothetical protein R3F60_18875 [bacterium]